jgi:glutamate N-acetyltransferase/amino-acid N-acetyltransferase
MAALAAEHLGLDRHDVLVASTGVIGVPLPMEKVRQGILNAHPTRDGGPQFVRAMMTTDTFAKSVSTDVSLRNGRGIIGGAAKGAGMIHPNMATLLAFVTTDLAVEPHFLRDALRAAADVSFNMITIDGDTSTNDTLLLFANGAAGNPEIGSASPEAHTFQEALNAVCVHLAKLVARDGEGATKLMEVRARGAASVEDARRVARTIAGSSLFKAAVYGNDPNWGRILAAAGRSGAELDQERADVFAGDICLMRAGQPQVFDRSAASRVMQHPEVTFSIDLHLGSGQATAWGCDLTEEYVRFNAEYTT